MAKSITPRRLIHILEQEGFVFKRSKGSHRIFQHPNTKRRAIVPFHTKDLPPGTLHSILKQAGVDLDEVI